MMKAPKGCKTLKKCVEEYTITAADIRFMEKAAGEIDKMLGYYINMTENRTGELVVKGTNAGRLEKLIEVIDCVLTTLNDVQYTD